jgi:hypothetical protein
MLSGMTCWGIKHYFLAALFAFLCLQPSTVQAQYQPIVNPKIVVALTVALSIILEKTSSTEFDLFHKHTPQDLRAFGMAILVFVHLVLELQNSMARPRQGNGFRLIVSLFGLAGIMLNPSESRFIVGTGASVIILLQRFLLREAVHNH